MNKQGLIRKIIVYAIYVMILTCFQVSFPDKISFNAQIADLMFVFVALVAYYYGIIDGIIIGLVVGVLRDCFAAPAISSFNGSITTSVGIGAFVMFLTAVFSATVFTQKMHRKMSFAIITVSVATLVYKVLGHAVIKIWMIVFSTSSYSLSIKEVAIDSILIQILLNVISALPLIFLLRFAGPYKNGVNPALSKNEIGGDQLWLTI